MNLWNHTPNTLLSQPLISEARCSSEYSYAHSLPPNLMKTAHQAVML